VVTSCTGHLAPDSSTAKQVAVWWREAELAARSRQIPRARRFLRWILASCPEDEEAWLWLARLASSQAARLAYLRQAYAFRPNSDRVQAALRQARTQQLESSVGDLKHSRALLRCLPDERHVRHASPPPGSNGRSRKRFPTGARGARATGYSSSFPSA
jgi:hypothetical protein